MDKKIKIGGISALGVAILLVIVTNIIHSHSEEKLIKLEEQVTYLTEEFTPMEFEISKYDDGEIKLKTVFYDLEGEKVGNQTLKLMGNELNFDFQVINIAPESYIFFPCGLYTDEMAIADSEKVFDAYNKNDFPRIYSGITEVKDKDGKEINKASKKEITDQLSLYFKLTMDGVTEFSEADTHGVAVHDIKNVSSFKKGFVYKVVCHPHTGAIEIVKK